MSRIYTTFKSSYILISRLLSENVGSKQKPVCQHQPEVQKLTKKDTGKGTLPHQQQV